MQRLWGKWESSGPVSCFECDLELQFHPIHVMHILSKGSHPKMRLDDENAIPGCKDCHEWFDHGLEMLDKETGELMTKTRKDMRMWKYIEKRIDYLKQKHY